VMSKHTPGPWVSKPATCGVFAADGNREVARTIWRGPNDDQEHIANNRLIAAAPDLLDALEEAARCWELSTNEVILDPESCECCFGHGWCWACTYSKVSAAIAKAKGEAR